MNLPKKRFSDSSREDILTYFESGGEESGIQLTDKQKDLIERWRFADEKIRENKYKREQIANFITNKFGVCRDTAYKDMVNAEYVFSSSFPLNKRYLIGSRIEFLQRKINDAFSDKEYEVAARLELVLQKYIKDYPDYVPPRSPKIINLVINQNNFNLNITAEEALEGSADIIKLLENNEDY